MNKKDFKRFMKQGLGRCVRTLQVSGNIEKYKEIVLWGCLHNLSYDTQCEGTRAEYIYRLTTFFDDEDYFVAPTIEAFDNIRRSSDWVFAHLCDLLCKFAEEGNQKAKEALHRKYQRFLSILINKQKNNGYDFERDNFERICINLVYLEGRKSILKIVSDMGRLFKENARYGCGDFDWFCSVIGDRFGQKRLNALLKREAERTEDIRYFYHNYLEFVEETQCITRNPREIPSAEDVKNEVATTGILSPSSRVVFSRRADKCEKQRLAETVIAESDPAKKAELLSAFAFGDDGFPLSHESIIEYSRSSCEKLRRISTEVLTNCQSRAVREYALRLLECGKHRADALEILLCNYTPADKNLLLAELQNIRVSYSGSSDWHGIHLKILDVGEQNVKLPKEFFIYVYNTTLCSCCREYAVRALAKGRWLTGEIIEECRYDSNYAICEYINRYYSEKN